jgi:Putative prokaryotic signal transducing protein
MRVLLSTFSDELSAHAMKAFLEENEMRCLLKLSPLGDGLLGGFGLQTGPTEVWVEDKDFLRASKLL